MNSATRNALENIWSVFVLVMIAITILAIVKREDMKRTAVQEYREAYHALVSQSFSESFPYVPQVWADAFTKETVDCLTANFSARVKPKDFVVRRVTFGLLDGNIERAASPSEETQRVCMERGALAAGGRIGEDVGYLLGQLFK
jgi:hypothetical protein